MRLWKLPALSQLKENQQQKRGPRNCERASGSSTMKNLFCFVCLKGSGSWLSLITASVTPQPKSRVSPACGFAAAAVKCLCNLQTAFLAKGMLPSCSEAERWLNGTYHSSCLAREFLREGLYAFNSGWPQTIFAAFSNLPDILRKKLHQVSNMVCWWEHACEMFLLLLLYFLLCQVLSFLCPLCLQHTDITLPTHLTVALVAALVTCWPFP